MKKILFSIVFLLLFSICTVGVSARSPSAVRTEEEILSPALCVLSEQYKMARWTMCGNDIYFSKEDFRRGLNIDEISSITIHSLPDGNSGALMIGSSSASVGDTVPVDNLSLLRYIPSDGSVSTTRFEFTYNDQAHPIVCELFTVKKQNTAPSSGIDEQMISPRTYTGVCLHGKMSGYDPDGDKMIFEVVEYPENGFITLDASTGRYIYTPIGSFSGKDSFTYIVRDTLGDYSATTEINLTVSKRSSSEVFADLSETQYHSHAVTVTEAGLMSGTRVGNGYYFFPEQSVRRIDFIVMAMNAAGITDLPSVKTTGFCDDIDIPSTMKDYAAAAYKLGYIHGTVENGELRLYPNEAISRAEAAYIMCNILGIKSSTGSFPVFADSLPSWAESAIYTAYDFGLIDTRNNMIASYDPLTRGESAQMFSAVLALLN